MQRLIESASHGVPAALREVTPGPDAEEADPRRLGLLRSALNVEWSDRRDQRPPRTPPRFRPRVPQPHPLHLPNSARHRRLQPPTTPRIGMIRVRYRSVRLRCGFTVASASLAV